MTACPIRYQRQVPDRKGKIFYTSITSLSHISKRRGESPSTPNIAGLQLEELHALRNRVRCTWLRHEPLRFVTTLNRALLS